MNKKGVALFIAIILLTAFVLVQEQTQQEKIEIKKFCEENGFKDVTECISKYLSSQPISDIDPTSFAQPDVQQAVITDSNNLQKYADNFNNMNLQTATGVDEKVVELTTDGNLKNLQSGQTLNIADKTIVPEGSKITITKAGFDVSVPKGSEINDLSAYSNIKSDGNFNVLDKNDNLLTVSKEGLILSSNNSNI